MEGLILLQYWPGKHFQLHLYPLYNAFTSPAQYKGDLAHCWRWPVPSSIKICPTTSMFQLRQEGGWEAAFAAGWRTPGLCRCRRGQKFHHDKCLPMSLSLWRSLVRSRSWSLFSQVPLGSEPFQLQGKSRLWYSTAGRQLQRSSASRNTCGQTRSSA